MVADVVVLSKDRPDLFAACLAGVEAQGVDVHGILVDNGTDGTTAQLARDAGWTVLDYGRNTGFSEGNNLAFGHTRTGRVLLLNNDAVLHPGAIYALLGHDEGIVGTLITGSAGLVAHAGGLLWNGIPKHQGRHTHPEEWACHACDWVTFAAVMIRRDVIDDIGPMDEGYWYSFEDVDYCLTAAKAGHSIAVCADARVTHDEGQTRDNSLDGPNRDRFYTRWPRAARHLVG